MEIGSPTIPTMRKYCSEESIHDAYFLPNSHYLINNVQSQSVLINYEFTFSEIKGGQVDKKTMNSSWQSRYFVLTPIRLLYFQDEGRTQLKGCFNLASLVEHKLEIASTFPEITMTTRVSFDGHQQTRILLVLQILSQGTFNEWLKALRQTIAYIKTNLLHLSIFPKVSVDQLRQNNQKILKSNINFWNKLTISSSQLLNYGSHLDIIFMRSKSAFSYLHRFFMRSFYDHVGILLKDEAEKPYLLEVINGKGVVISPLDNLLSSCNEEYEEIGYRKLISKPEMLPLERLESYINSILGKKYELSLSKLFLDNDTSVLEVAKGLQLTNFPEKPERTYFCSELIADIYLKFGVLAKGKSNDFWPKDFQENQLPLCDGYSLTPLMHVEIPVDQDLSAAEE